MKRIIILLAICALLACSSLWTLSPNETAVPAQKEVAMKINHPSPQNQSGSGFKITFSREKQDTSSGESLKVVTGETLSAPEREALIKRMPPFEKPPQAEPFQKRLSTRPAPRPGKTISGSFPSADAPSERPDEVLEAPLRVLRYSPEGVVATGASVSVTFSQPMIPLSSHENLEALPIPVKMTPEIEGDWRWLGTQTLIFDRKDRFPVATKFMLNIPVGTKSQQGGVLEEALSWTFETGRLKPLNIFPSEGQSLRLDPFFLIKFNGELSRTEAIQQVTMTAAGQPLELRALEKADLLRDKRSIIGAIQGLTPDHLGDDDQAYELLLNDLLEGPNKQPNRWLAFRAIAPLEPDTAIEVRLNPGIVSREGPLPTEEFFVYRFKTYPPLALKNTSWDRRLPQPDRPVTLFFNNPLDEAAFKQEWVSLEPAVEKFAVECRYSRLTISGKFKAKTSYRIRIDGALKDFYGQTLGKTLARTFTVDSPRPFLRWHLGAVQLMDPALKPMIHWANSNYEEVEVQVKNVKPQHWSAYRKGMRESWQADPSLIPGETVYSEKMNLTERERLSVQEQSLDLKPFLENGTGQFIVTVQVKTDPNLLKKRGFRPQSLISWIQFTQLGVVVFSDNQTMNVWASQLKDGQPVQGAEVTLLESGSGTSLGQGSTDPSGLTSFALPTKRNGQELLVVVKKGDDLAIFPEKGNSYKNWNASQASARTVTYLTDSRGMYRPGEQVNIKGWVRQLHPERASAPQLLPAKQLQFTVHDSRNNKFAEGDVDVSEMGGLDFRFDLPDDINLGSATIYLRDTATAKGSANSQAYQQATYNIRVEEFRRPEYEVNVQLPPGPHKMGDTLDAQVKATYFSGGGLAQAPVDWRIEINRTHYAPPGWPGFSFGKTAAWWEHRENSNFSSSHHTTGETDAEGIHELSMTLDKAEQPLPHLCRLTAAVRDINAQEWQGRSSFLIHPGDVYVGLRTNRYFVEKGQPFGVEALVTDLDGKVLPGQPFDVEVHRLEWQRNGTTKEIQVFKKTMTSASEPISFTFPTPEGGRYSVRALVTDSKDRESMSEFSRWVTGSARQNLTGTGLQTLKLIPDKEFYQPGDFAEILVQAPFQPAEGMASVSQHLLKSLEPLVFDGETAVVRVPITEKDIPNLQVQVEVVGHSPREDASGLQNADLPRQPAHAYGILKLKVPPLKRQLNVSVLPEVPVVMPGTKTRVRLVVKDAEGSTIAGAQLALMMVDESVLALSGFELGDPLTAFYPEVGSLVRVDRMRMLLERRAQEQHFLAADAPMERSMKMSRSPVVNEMMVSPSAEAGGGAADEPIHIRRDFNALAAFLPSLVTNSSGEVIAEIDLPDNLTRYRIMVIAASGSTDFGTGEANLTAQLPLMLRPSPPRFLNYGDQFELPFVVQNQTEEALIVNLVARTQNLAMQDSGGRRFQLEAGQRVEVLLAGLAESAGTARVQAAVFADGAMDAAEIAFPVWTPATTEAFATYGVLDEGSVAQNISPPDDVFAAFGGLEITTSSTALQGLTDAFIYLVNYPFSCSEQISSRILAAVALRDVLDAFEGDVNPEQLREVVAADLTRLASLQNSDGGFGFWRKHEKSWPFLTIHVAHALVRAKTKGFEIPTQTLEVALRYLASIENHFEKEWDQRTRYSLSAYALYVLELSGQAKPGKASEIFNSLAPEEAPMEALGWLLPSLGSSERDRLLGFLNNRISETAATAQFTSRYEDKGHLVLHAERRDDAVLLESLIRVSPESDVIVKLVRGLLGARVKGRWSSTQENVFVLLAMDKYFQTYEKQTPQFLAQIWLGNQFAGDQRYSGRETVRRELKVPMDWLQNTGPTDLLLSKQGEGRLYYRLGMRYAPKNLKLEPASHGFFVSRTYAAVEDPEDVTVAEDGRIVVKRGAKVKVTVSMVAPARRYHVALVDPLPAGFEPMNPAMKMNAPPNQQKTRPWVWRWFGHQNLRDERAEAFATQVYAGEHEYSYIARATTPGIFVVPPAKAEEMYHPETFGRGATTRVEVR